MQRAFRRERGGMNPVKVALVPLAAMSVAVLVACGTTQVDTTRFVDGVNRQFQKALDAIPRVSETGAAVEMSCPAKVEEGKPFECTISGKLSGDTETIRLTTKPTDDANRDDVVPVSKRAVEAAYASVSEAEGKAAGRAIAEGK